MKSFAVGDTVRYIGAASFVREHGEIHIISEAHFRNRTTPSYATNRGAWFTNDDFELVEKATLASFKQLAKASTFK